MLRQFIAQRDSCIAETQIHSGVKKEKNMFQQWRKLNYATTFAVLSLMTMAPVQAQETATPAEPSGDAGFFLQSGGAVKRKLAKTQTAATTFGETATWFRLPGANLAYTVPAGASDLFNVSFTAECRLFNGGGDDYVRIRIIDLNTGVPLEPYDGGQAFCSDDGYATYTGMWSKRLGAGVHTLQVELWIFDGAPAEVLSSRFDDWTFEVIIYE
jgi:hypothetical protein